MTEILGPLHASGLRRDPVVCSLCGTAWDDRLVPEDAVQEQGLSLCVSCLLVTSHGEPPRA